MWDSAFGPKVGMRPAGVFRGLLDLEGFMGEGLRLGRVGIVLALALVWVFLVVSLLGQDPADPPGGGSFPLNAAPLNPGGRLGSIAAHALIDWLGSSAAPALALMPIVVIVFLSERSQRRAWKTTTGLAVCLLTATALAYETGLRIGPISVIGPGGYSGMLLVESLKTHAGPMGCRLTLFAMALVGLGLMFETLSRLPFFGSLARPARASRLFMRLGALTRTEFRRHAGNPNEPAHSVMPEVIDSAGARHPLAPKLAPWDRQKRSPEPAPVSERSIPISNGAGPRPADLPRRLASNAPPIPTDGSYEPPPVELLDPPPEFAVHEREAKIHERAAILERTLLDFGYQVRVVQIDTGPVITQFELELEAGLRVSRVIGLADDLAIALAVPSVRVVAPIPGKTTVGVEVPNDARAIVRLREVFESLSPKLSRSKIPLYLGKDVKGTPLAFDLVDMPHLLIAGRTGTGKSVCLNAMILSILMTKSPHDVKLLLIDPKMVELSQFKRIPHLMHPVVTDMKKAESILSWACDKMDERYGYLARAGVRNIQAYNELGAEEIYARLGPEDDNERAAIPTHMPYIVIVADEMADLMMTAAKEVESHIVRLAQKARAVGMHLLVATQKPTVDVITGLIKGNLPARIAFQVASRGDSRVVLDEMGADRLLGNGDMLFLIPGTSHIIRAQGTYVSDSEVNRICSYLQQYPVEFNREIVQLQVSGGPGGKERGEALRQRDEHYEAAIEIVIREGRGSCSLLQRALGIGYGRAARLIDFMAEDGIVGEYKSGAAREVLYSWDEWEALKQGGAGESIA